MELNKYIFQLYDYHYWATHQVLDAAEKLSEEQRHQAMGIGWGNIHATLLHMMETEWMWLDRWKGESPQAYPGLAEFHTLKDIQKEWSRIERDVLDYVNKLDVKSLDARLSYTDIHANAYNIQVWQILPHIPLHGARHRGMLAEMFKQLNAQYPEDDWVEYLMKSETKQKKTE